MRTRTSRSEATLDQLGRGGSGRYDVGNMPCPGIPSWTPAGWCPSRARRTWDTQARPTEVDAREAAGSPSTTAPTDVSGGSTSTHEPGRGTTSRCTRCSRGPLWCMRCSARGPRRNRCAKPCRRAGKRLAPPRPGGSHACLDHDPYRDHRGARRDRGHPEIAPTSEAHSATFTAVGLALGPLPAARITMRPTPPPPPPLLP